MIVDATTRSLYRFGEPAGAGATAAASVNGSAYNLTQATFDRRPPIVRGPTAGSLARHFEGQLLTTPRHQMSSSTGLTAAVTLFGSAGFSILFPLRLEASQVYGIPFAFAAGPSGSYEAGFEVYVDGQVLAVEWASGSLPSQVFLTNLTDEIPLGQWVSVRIDVVRNGSDWEVTASWDGANSTGMQSGPAPTAIDSSYVFCLGWSVRNENNRVLYGSVGAVEILDSTGTRFEYWAMEEPPELLDEGPAEEHLWSRGTPLAVPQNGLANGRGSRMTVAAAANEYCGQRSNYIHTDLQDLLRAGGFTIECWATVFDSTAIDHLLYCLDWNSYDSTVEAEAANILGGFRLLSGRTLDYFRESGAGTNQVTVTPSPAASTVGMHHYALVVDEDHRASFYVDAVLVWTDTAVTPGVPTGGTATRPYVGGFQPTTSTRSRALFHELRISNVDLDAAAISASYGAHEADPEPEPGDEDPPVITFVTTELESATTPIVLQVTDENLGTVFLEAVYRRSGSQVGPREVIHDDQGFAAPYTGSTVEAIEGGQEFTLRRQGGWPLRSAVEIRAVAFDTEGN